jgi:hypothetical protein
VPTLKSFRNKIKQSPNEKAPAYYLSGNRYLSVMHARLRNNCSNLNGDLHNNHLRDDPYCSCNNNEFENASHFFFSCPNYREQRLELFIQTREFHPLNINILLFGNTDLTYEQNSILFKAVQQFIKDTKRF